LVSLGGNIRSLSVKTRSKKSLLLISQYPWQHCWLILISFFGREY